MSNILRSVLLIAGIHMSASQLTLQDGTLCPLGIWPRPRLFAANRCPIRAAGSSPFARAWEGGNISVVLSSVSDGLSLYEPDTESWVGFAPDFVKMMSNDLGFTYDITDERSLCEVVLTEYFRGFIRAGISCQTIFNNSVPDACCTAAATKAYERTDFNMFAVQEKNNASCPVPVARVTDDYNLCQNMSTTFLQVSEASPFMLFVRKSGPKIGELFKAQLMLHAGAGENPHATPINVRLAIGDIPRMWGDGLSTTPMFTEESETLVFTTTEQSMCDRQL